MGETQIKALREKYEQLKRINVQLEVRKSFFLFFFFFLTSSFPVQARIIDLHAEVEMKRPGPLQRKGSSVESHSSGDDTGKKQ